MADVVIYTRWCFFVLAQSSCWIVKASITTSLASMVMQSCALKWRQKRVGRASPKSGWGIIISADAMVNGAGENSWTRCPTEYKQGLIDGSKAKETPPWRSIGSSRYRGGGVAATVRDGDYIKDASFESPASPDIFRQNWQPNINVDLNTKSQAADDTGNHEVILTITVTAKQDDKNAFLVESSRPVFSSYRVSKESSCVRFWRQWLPIFCSPTLVRPLITW